jgi:hypothetical protein
VEGGVGVSEDQRDFEFFWINTRAVVDGCTKYYVLFMDGLYDSPTVQAAWIKWQSLNEGDKIERLAVAHKLCLSRTCLQ